MLPLRGNRRDGTSQGLGASWLIAMEGTIRHFQKTCQEQEKVSVEEEAVFPALRRRRFEWDGGRIARR